MIVREISIVKERKLFVFLLTNAFSFVIMLWQMIRDVAQLVARVLWEHDVAGSNPVIPTK